VRKRPHLSQVKGSKRVLLIPPAHEADCYPITADRLQNNSSQVDAEAPDLARFPRFAAARVAGCSVDLHAGDLLYVPRRWWHHVRSLSSSISVSIWWL